MTKLTQSFIIIFFVSILVFLSYRSITNAPFVFDDLPNIVENRLVHLDNFSSTKLAKLKQTFKSRPLAMASFALNYYFGQLDPFGYHIVNIIIHITAAIILYFLVGALLTGTPYQAQSFLITAATASLFATHPIQTQSVTYIVQRMSSMAGMFFLFTLLAYMQGRLVGGKKRMGWWLLSGISACCAFASKEISATLPIFIFLIETHLKPQGKILREKQTANNTTSNKSSKKNKRKDKKKQPNILAAIKDSQIKPQPTKPTNPHWLLWTGGLAIIIILTLAYTGFDLGALTSGYKVRDFTLGQRLLTQPRVLIYYLSLLSWPLPGRFNLDYDFFTSTSLINPPTTIVCMLFLAGLLWLSFYISKKEPLISFCIWWFLGNLAIESSFIPLEMVFEHRLYLPSVGVFFLAALLFAKLCQKFELKEFSSLILMLPVIILLSISTYQRNQVWKTELSLWQDVVSKSPNKARPHLSLGAAYAHRGRYKEAVPEYKKALKIRPDYAKPYYNLGLALEKQGNKKEALAAYQKAVQLKPNYGEAHNNLGGLYFEERRFDEAEKEFLTALRLKPEFIEIRANLATIYFKRGDKQRAKQEYIELLKQRPTIGEIHYNLATIYAEDGDYQKARHHLKLALRFRPKRPPLSVIQNLLNRVEKKLNSSDK